MNLLGIVAVSGKPGLWRALVQNKNGYILESLDAAKIRMVANISTAKIAALNEITLFGLDDDIKLVDVFERMKAVESIPDAKADGNKLRGFFREVAPGHDEEKVYASDMKKVINWYLILKDFTLFTEDEPGANAVEEAATEVKEEPVAELPVKAVELKADAAEPEKAPAKPKAKKPVAKKA
jgi:hypothetical protein